MSEKQNPSAAVTVCEPRVVSVEITEEYIDSLPPEEVKRLLLSVVEQAALYYEKYEKCTLQLEECRQKLEDCERDNRTLYEKYKGLRDFAFGKKSESLKKWDLDDVLVNRCLGRQAPAPGKNQETGTTDQSPAGSSTQSKTQHDTRKTDAAEHDGQSDTVNSEEAGNKEDSAPAAGKPEEQPETTGAEEPKQEPETAEKPEDKEKPGSEKENKDDKTVNKEKKATKTNRLGDINCPEKRVECRFTDEWKDSHPNARLISPLEYEEYVIKKQLVRIIYIVDQAEFDEEQPPMTNAAETEQDESAQTAEASLQDKTVQTTEESLQDESVQTTEESAPNVQKKPKRMLAGGFHPVVSHSKAGIQMRCYTIMNQVNLGIPYYRQSYEFSMSGYEISSQNLLNWAEETWHDFFFPIYLHLMDQVGDQKILFMDETRYKVNELKDLLNSTGACWIVEARTGAYEDKQIVVYYFRPNRSEAFLEEVLKMKVEEYVIHSDKLAVYTGWKNIINVLCHDHNRREIVKAAKVEPGFVKYREIVQKKGTKSDEAREWLDTPGNERLKDIISALNLYKILYKNERDYKRENLAPEQIRERREKESRPVLDALYGIYEKYFIKTSRPAQRKTETKEHYQMRVNEWKQTLFEAKEAGFTLVDYGSKWSDAIIYAQRSKVGFYEYLRDGKFQISNISAETGMKVWSRIRNNSMFSTSIKGVIMEAGMASIIKTYELNGYKVLETMEYIVEALSAVHVKGEEYDPEVLDSLMPWSGQLPEHLKIGSPSLQKPDYEDGDILYFNGNHPDVVGHRNPKKEAEYKKMAEEEYGRTNYRTSRSASRRKERLARSTEYVRKERTIDQTLPKRLCA